ncbi:hypothetical protein JVT61DRAFT_14148 [Boletus reticuloceps]|uniref:Uncharacterized protein n=1 Tax=Boletus reticuloceps TaxID=495285 RepID=A0A8I3A483_9AGAM|nr:hypothetical protein JVT61DRAFT_14148 [Boletus reticuloceps]
MAPVRKKYNWSHKILTTAPCQHCGNTFKSQGLRSHELHCVRRKGKERQHVQSSMEYEQDLEQCTSFDILSSQIFTIFSQSDSATNGNVIIHEPQRRSWSFRGFDNSNFPAGFVSALQINTAHSESNFSSHPPSEHKGFIGQDMLDPRGDSGEETAAAIDLYLQSCYQTSRWNFTHAAIVVLFSNTKKILAYGTLPNWLPMAAHGIHSSRRVTTSSRKSLCKPGSTPHK